VTAAIVTCGGLCPGLNDVVQNLVYTLADYGVPEDQILGIRYGLRGFYERDDKPITLTRHMVDGIHLKGGTMLVRGRGGGAGAEDGGAGRPARGGGRGGGGRGMVVGGDAVCWFFWGWWWWWWKQ
jgi:6-phosphofructokinase